MPDTIEDKNGELRQLVEQWKSAAVFFERLRALPATLEGFTEAYGSFDTALVTGFLSAVQGFADCESRIGSPAALKAIAAQDPGALTREPDAKDSLLRRVVWLVEHCGKLSDRVVADYGRIRQLPAKGSVKEAAACVRGLLAGDGGLTGAALVVKGAAWRLAEDIEQEAGKLEEARKVYAENLLPREASARRDAAQVDAAYYAKMAETARKDAEKSILGKKKKMANYLELKQKHAQASAEAKNLVRFTHDSGGIGVDAKKSVIDMLTAASSVRRFVSQYAEILDRWTSLLQLSDEEHLGDPAWMAKALDMDEAEKDMRQAQKACVAFVHACQ